MSMARQLVYSLAILLLAGRAVAQDGLALPPKTPPKLEEEARSIYVAACSTVQQEFGHTHTLNPKVTLVLGAQKDGVLWAKNEVHLRKWDRSLFAQGVVILAFGELLPDDERLAIAKRALNWADSTVSVQQLRR
jgi:hypothetical protein